MEQILKAAKDHPTDFFIDRVFIVCTFRILNFACLQALPILARHDETLQRGSNREWELSFK